MRQRPWVPVLLCLLLVCTSAGAREETSPTGALEGLSGEKALVYCRELASTAMQGRKTAREGGALVENWMLQKMAECGLLPADTRGAYLEPFAFGAANTIAPIRLAIGGKELTYGSEYGDLGYTGAGKIAAEVVFCGHGISRPDLGWDDYAGIDVAGKVVLALSGVPAERAFELSAERALGSKSSTAADKGAAAFLLAASLGEREGTIRDHFHRSQLPALWVSTPVASRILGPEPGRLAKLMAGRDVGAPCGSFATGSTVSLEVHAQYEARALGHNALGYLRGHDPALSEEIILVTANMDHLGRDPTGEVRHGANDNASGSAVLLHLAEVLTANGLRPKRRIVFCALGAKEQGRAGSLALAAQAPFQGKIVAVLNLQRVGRGQADLHVDGGGAYPEMQRLLETYLGKDQRARVQFGRRALPDGDQQPFAERGSPAFSISRADTPRHGSRPTDDMGGIQADHLEAAARLVGTLAVGLANHPKALADPLGIASYLIREGPRFAMDNLVEQPDKSFAMVRSRMHAERMQSGLSVLIVDVPEDLDPAVAWKALEALEEKQGPVRYRLVRRADDIERAFVLGEMGILPRLRCARTAHADPSCLRTYAALGYRWLAPWSTGTRRRQSPQALAPILTVAKSLKVALDISDLAEEHYAELRTGLGDRPAMILLTAPPQGHTLGPRVLPIVRFRRGANWQAIIDACVGMAPPVVYSPRGLRQAKAIVEWGATRPPGWDLPGSSERKAIRAALGGRLVEWLARAER